MPTHWVLKHKCIETIFYKSNEFPEGGKGLESAIAAQWQVMQNAMVGKMTN
jgi:hypothetical protein